MQLPVLISEQEVYSGWLRVIRREMQHANGGRQIYDIVNPDSHSVCAVALTPDQQVIMLEQYRFAQHKRLMELPAGGVEDGESIVDAMRRELLEETGYAGELTEIGSHFIGSEHGITRHVFVIQQCVQVADAAPEQSEIDEGAQVMLVTLDEFRAIVRSGQLTETGGAFMGLDFLGLL